MIKNKIFFDKYNLKRANVKKYTLCIHVGFMYF